jgi:hypothetical protein
MSRVIFNRKLPTINVGQHLVNNLIKDQALGKPVKPIPKNLL